MLSNHMDRQLQSSQNSTRPQQGQSLTEFALTMPLLIGLLVGIVLLAWVGFTYVSITSAARMGTRHMVSYPIEPEHPARFADIDSEITYMVTTTMPFLNWRAAQITILPQPPEKRRVVNPDDPNQPTYMSVQIVYPVNNPTIKIPYIIRDGSFVLLPPISLQATARMRLD
jgi:Flp pilus assembly protein TadG